MANIRLNKGVFNKRDYERTIDTKFTQLGTKSVEEQINEQPSIEDFFQMYNDLFYDIPEVGAINSHEYLVKASGEYINYNENDELIEALQNEIATLRQELLASQQQLTEQQTPQQ